MPSCRSQPSPTRTVISMNGTPFIAGLQLVGKLWSGDFDSYEAAKKSVQALAGIGTWGITISASILKNELKNGLPPAFVAQCAQGIEIAYAAIPAIRTLDEPARTEVRAAFAASLAVVWRAMIGISAAGFVSVLFVREIPMQKHTDDTYGLEGGPGGAGKRPASGDADDVEREGASKMDVADSIELPTKESSVRAATPA